jgi:hypothetical protein
MSTCSFHSANIRHSGHPVERLRCAKPAVVIGVMVTEMHGQLHQLPISVLCPYSPLRSQFPSSLMLLLCSSSLFILSLLFATLSSSFLTLLLLLFHPLCQPNSTQLH